MRNFKRNPFDPHAPRPAAYVSFRGCIVGGPPNTRRLDGELTVTVAFYVPGLLDGDYWNTDRETIVVNATDQCAEALLGVAPGHYVELSGGLALHGGKLILTVDAILPVNLDLYGHLSSDPCYVPPPPEMVA